ncbi:guanine deaminase [Kaistia algarum]|uniref:guanine deaminase n=1 Tax=Kaistia algarum TaxID=2083279 RepID=UPI000CE7EE39|nr:guanine deaminase [Kaistia algarum]MCX5516707.1 guanine deaminase [Kaistia algarum]PPE78597.1 guanine deaminase [Kaistia algarum]
MRRALRGPTLSFRGDPFRLPFEEAVHFRPDALIVIEDGVIVAVEDAATALAALPADIEVDHYPDAILSAGFIDAHVHYPQMQMIGAYGDELLAWLEKYTFVAEQDFADAAHASDVAGRFLRELLRAGTTTAAVYCTVHPGSVEAFFTESERFNTRMIAGKVLMDRNAPEALRDTAETGYEQSKALIERWHGRGRQLYCVTPRFAPSSTEAQLEEAGRLWREHPGTYLQTHLCENRGEIDWVRQLFPERSSYLDVYDHAGLTGPCAIFGHAVYMDETDFACCHRTGSALAHCPTSNLFLGSGLFKMVEARRTDRPVHVALGTDLGAGTAFSQLQTMNEAYKVAKLGGTTLTPAQAFWLATRGAAEALHLDDRLGTIEPGKEADIIVLDPKATPLLEFRSAYCRDLSETLSVLMTLGDDRAIRATYVAGERVYDRERKEAFCYAGEGQTQ